VTSILKLLPSSGDLQSNIALFFDTTGPCSIESPNSGMQAWYCSRDKLTRVTRLSFIFIVPCCWLSYLRFEKRDLFPQVLLINVNDEIIGVARTPRIKGDQTLFGFFDHSIKLGFL